MTTPALLTEAFHEYCHGCGHWSDFTRNLTPCKDCGASDTMCPACDAVVCDACSAGGE